MSGELIAFLSARLDEDEAAAKAVEDRSDPWPGQWVADGNRALRTYNGWVMAVSVPIGSDFTPGVLAHIARYDPARALREVEAKRALTELHRVNEEPQRWGDSHSNPAMRGQPTGRTSYWCDECDHDRDYGHIGGPEEGCGTLRHLAAVYSDHPDYRQEWMPNERADDYP